MGVQKRWSYRGSAGSFECKVRYGSDAMIHSSLRLVTEDFCSLNSTSMFVER